MRDHPAITFARQFWAIAWCCLPGLAIALLVSIGVLLSVNGKRNDVEPNTLFLLLAGLACPIIMGVMMWLMNRNMSHQQKHSVSDDMQKGMSAASRLAELREQRQILEAEIAELTQITELEEQHKALLADYSSAPDETPISAMR